MGAVDSRLGAPTALTLVVVLHSTVPSTAVRGGQLTFRLLKRLPPSGRLAARWQAVNTDFQPVLQPEDVIQFRDLPTSDFNKLVEQRLTHKYYLNLGPGRYDVEVSTTAAPATRLRYSLGVDFGSPRASAWRYVYSERAPFSVTAPLPVACIGIDTPCL